MRPYESMVWGWLVIANVRFVRCFDIKLYIEIYVHAKAERTVKRVRARKS